MSADGASASPVMSARPWLHAHRGASADAPENTMAAFRLALQQGADGIELDVRLSADGVPVVIHDATLDRTTDRSGLVRELDAAVIAVADAGARWSRATEGDPLPRESADVRVPTLAEVVDWLPADRGLVVDIKDPAAVPAIVRILERRVSASETVRLIAFDPRAIEAARRLAPSIPTGLLLESGDSIRAGIALASRDGHASIVPFDGDLGDDPGRAIAAAADAALSVGCYVVNDRDRLVQLRAAGVAFVMTDVPALVRSMGEG